MDRGGWLAVVYRVANSWTRLKLTHSEDTGKVPKFTFRLSERDFSVPNMAIVLEFCLLL